MYRHFRNISLLFLLTLVVFSQSQNPYKARTEIPEQIRQAPAWNNKNFQDNPNHFQFMIVADRTGGMRKGVFASAIPKINQLRPEFVISVGDLIDGYTEDRDYLETQWQEFDGIINKLKMPFFHIPGNHDITNEMMAEVWTEKVGAPYYHFRFKDVLFLCLNTEDPHASITTEQFQYFESVLSDHRDVRWTMVFMHQPLWAYDDQGGYENIAALLSDRPYTLFSGHYHSYVKAELDGQRHYILGTTGGWSRLRHVDLGELDHMMWVTMTDTGPVIANLTLDGILPDDLVTENTLPMVDALRQGSWLNIPPVITDNQFVSQITVPVTLQNPTGKPLFVEGQFPATDQYSFEPDNLKLELDPESNRSMNVIVNFNHPTDIDILDDLALELSGGYQIKSDELVSLKQTKPLLLDTHRYLEQLSQPITIDGQLKDWAQVSWISSRNPQYVKEDWDWKGPEDGWFSHAITYNDEFVFLAVETFDDKILFDPALMIDPRDQLFIHLNVTRPNSDNADPNMSGEINMLRLKVGPGKDINAPLFESSNELPADVLQAMSVKDDGFIYELAFPIRIIEELSGSHMNNLHLNIAFMDHDNSKNIKPSILWWRPPWDGDHNYDDAGWYYK